MPTTTPFQNLITFSRGSNATVTGPNGLIQWAPANLLTFSEQMDNAAWVKTAAIVTANSTVAPNGTTTADTITASVGAGYHYAAQNVAAVAGTTYTASMYVRAGTARYIGFGDAGDAAWHSAYLDTTDGSILNQVNCVATAVSVGGGWFFVTNTFTRTNAANVQIYVGGSTVTGNAGPFFTATGTETCIAWGAQLELGSTATTYNPTSVKNLLGFSEAFDNAAWTKANASIVTGAQANPVNGLFNAQKLMENTAAAANHYVQQILGSLNAGKPITLSVYAKAGERRYIGLLEGYSNKGQYFDLQTGTVGGVLSGAPTSASITAVGNGWYRCTITTSVLSATASLEVYLSNTGATISYTGDGNSGVYIYGAQLSDSASLDPYVPTPGAAPSSTAYYGPRFDYDPATLQPRGILIEEQRTNAVTYSAQFENVAWVKNNAQIVPDIDPAAATLGPELCINGDFASGTGWTANTGWVISGGQATATATSTSMYGGQMTTVAGRVYRIDFDIVSYTSGDLLVTIGQNYDGPVRFTSPSATRRTAYVVSGTNTTRGVEFYGGTVTCAIDNVSVREVIGGALQAPDGTFTADTLLAVNTTSAGLVRSFASTAVAYTFSVYLKQGNTSFSEIEIIDQGTIVNRVRLTYATGALTVVSGSPTGTATSVGNGWWRVTITYTFPAIGAADTLVVYPSTTTGTIGQYCFAWGAQLEAGAFATSYIPTIASTVTRSADVATISGSLFSQWYRQDQGTLVLDFGTVMGPAALVGVVFGGGSQAFQARVDGGLARSSIRGVADLISATGPSVSMPGSNKVSYAYLSGSNGISANGGATVTSAVTFTSSGGTLAALGSDGLSSSNYLNGHIRSIRYIPVRSADFQLQALST